MIYIELDSTNVYENFGLEYYLAMEKLFEETVFLFWRTTPTLMLGRYQNLMEEINLPYVREKGIHLVRRMSGGGTIYTDLGGWQFSFIDRDRGEEIDFRGYLSPILNALEKLSVHGEFNGRNDLCIEGRKFSGNAQYRLGKSIVHHGSLLFDTDIEQMVASTKVDECKIRSKSIQSVRERVCNIAEHLQEKISPEVFKRKMIEAIMAADPKSREYELESSERERVSELAREHFENKEKLYGKNPKFSIEKTGRFPGGKMQFSFEVKEGKIQEAAVSRDFFSTLDEKEIAEAFIGLYFDKDSLYEGLKSRNLEGKIYRISAEEIAEFLG